MKTILNATKQLKVLITFDGKTIITLPGGQQKEGLLLERELSMIAYRVTAITEGEVSFSEPQPEDFFTEFDDQVKTLELQAIALNELRENVTSEQLKNTVLDEACKAEVAKQDEILKRLTECETDLVAAREALKDSRIELSAANEQLAAYLQTPPPVVTEELPPVEGKQQPELASAQLDDVPTVPFVTVEDTVNLTEGPVEDVTPANYTIVQDESESLKTEPEETPANYTIVRDTEPPTDELETEPEASSEVLSEDEDDENSGFEEVKLNQ